MIYLFIILVIVLVFMISFSQYSKEYYSYHFGFPTWGSINNRFIGRGGLRSNPFMYNYNIPYYRSSIRPYLSVRCYTSSKSDHCTPGYRKVKKDTDGDGKRDTFKCCRRY